ncbi:MAG: GWxTD domain-containing protein [Calditrichaeota bacterium]|nr:GWxTD domain-containing protein [Calditrichota bacterium]MCB9366441.1 GWxTD domain-containing protein [Calditrichota bacterium]
MTRKVWLALLLLFAWSSESWAEGMDVDAVYFYGNDSLTYCEVYVSVQREVLYYATAGEDSVVADFSLIASLSEDGNVFLSDTLDTRDAVSREYEANSGAYFPYTFGYFIRPGEYVLDVTLYQLGGRKVNQVRKALDVPEMNGEFGLSGIALGAELSYSDSASSFFRKGVDFTPNPSGLYGSGLPMLYYYLECYGLRTDSLRPDDSISVRRTIYYSESGEPAKKPSVRKIHKPGPSAVISDGFPAYTLRTGTYQLELVVQEAGMPDRTTRRKFFVLRPEDLELGRAVELDAEFRNMILRSAGNILDSIDPDSALALMDYVMTRQDAKRVRNMDTDGKKRFLYEFWQNRDPESPDGANIYFARVAEANRRYTFLQNKGWKTDRGRVLIIHGEPTHIERRYVEAQKGDYEVWYYDQLEGGVIFVFSDCSGFGDLELVHSTKRGEIYNPTWAETVNTTSRGLR